MRPGLSWILHVMIASLDGLYPEGQVIQTYDLLCFCVFSFFRKLTYGHTQNSTVQWLTGY